MTIADRGWCSHCKEHVIVVCFSFEPKEDSPVDVSLCEECAEEILTIIYEGRIEDERV